MVGWISILILGTIYQSRLLADTIASVRLVLTNDNESAEELDVEYEFAHTESELEHIVEDGVLTRLTASGSGSEACQ
jgi:hypothetical protein